MNKKIEIISLIILAILTFYLRFVDLGFHHFYGDEVKTLFLRKDQSAFDFFLEQRKGPIQFLIVWGMEKITGSYEEVFMRLPFAIFGFALVFVFYYFVRNTLKQDYFVSIFSTILVSLNGIYIAFSRTAQYQMVYLVFSFLALIFFGKFVEENTKKKKLLFFTLSVIFFTLGLLSHYDTLFFLLPLFFYFKKFKQAFLVLFLSSSISFLFYGPQIYFGFFTESTAGYLAKRIVGKEYLPNFTPYTFLLYNPLYVYVGLLFVLAIAGYYLSKKEDREYLARWFFIPFILLDFFVLVPGTHVHNYLFPLFIFSGVAFSFLIKKYKYSIFVFIPAIIFIFLVQVQVFLPKYNLGYPFIDSSIFGISQLKLNKGYSTPIYGFVYNRNWQEIAEFMKSQKRVPAFMTNDNKVVAEYYLFGYAYTGYDPRKPAPFYIEILNPQEIDKTVPIDPLLYEVIKEGAGYKIYKLITFKQ